MEYLLFAFVIIGIIIWLSSLFGAAVLTPVIYLLLYPIENDDYEKLSDHTPIYTYLGLIVLLSSDFGLSYLTENNFINFPITLSAIFIAVPLIAPNTLRKRYKLLFFKSQNFNRSIYGFEIFISILFWPIIYASLLIKLLLKNTFKFLFTKHED